MSCTTIELNRKAVTGLEEIGKKYRKTFPVISCLPSWQFERLRRLKGFGCC